MFKVGDIVVGNQNSPVNGVEEGTQYKVLRVVGEFVDVDGPFAGHWVSTYLFDLLREQGSLPPVPVSTLYLGEFPSLDLFNPALEVIKTLDNKGLWLSIRESASSPVSRSIRISPETAKALSSDLLRMALAIERKQVSEE